MPWREIDTPSPNHWKILVPWAVFVILLFLLGYGASKVYTDVKSFDELVLNGSPGPGAMIVCQEHNKVLTSIIAQYSQATEYCLSEFDKYREECPCR